MISKIPARRSEKYIKTKQFDLYQQILKYTSFLINPKWSDRIYCYENNIKNINKCLHCGKQINNIRQKYCSKSCSTKASWKNKDKEKIKNKISESIKKYHDELDNKTKNEINRKRIQSCKEYHINNKEETIKRIEKAKQTCLEKYDVDNYAKSKEFRERHDEIFNKVLEKKRNALYERINHIEEWLNEDLFKERVIKCYNVLDLCKYFNLSYTYISIRMKKLHINAYKTYRSNDEIDIVKFLTDNNIKNIITNSKSIIYPYELDIYLPDYKIAIEFNGDYWHSSKNKDKNYHYNKTKLCNEKGIRLIHIFEYEYKNNTNKIMNWLLSQIKNDNIIYARKCEIREIETKVKNEFLNKYHLQGEDKSKIKLGLFYNNELISVMTFGKNRFKEGLELIRYCVKHNYKIIGGASKLFKHFTKNYYNNEQLTSYQNLSKFNGNLYKNLGFKLTSISNPNYVYVKDSEVLSRYQCQKHKLIKQGYNEKNTESEIMEEDGYLKIYDCGNNVWMY